MNEKEKNAIESLKEIKDSQSESIKKPITNSTLSKLLLNEQKQPQEIKSHSNQIWNGISSPINPISIKYNIFWFNPNESGKIYEIILELPGDLKVEDCILLSIREFNKNLQAKGQIFQLPENISFYEMRFAKKSGQPKDDYPALDPSQIISQTKVLSLCLIYNNQLQQSQKELPIPKEINYQKSLNDFKRTTSASSQDEMLPQGNCCFCFSITRSKKALNKCK